jgi:hypothetical protein
MPPRATAGTDAGRDHPSRLRLLLAELAREAESAEDAPWRAAAETLAYALRRPRVPLSERRRAERALVTALLRELARRDARLGLRP